MRVTALCSPSQPAGEERAGEERVGRAAAGRAGDPHNDWGCPEGTLLWFARAFHSDGAYDLECHLNRNRGRAPRGQGMISRTH